MDKILDPSEYSREIKNSKDFKKEKNRLEYEAIKKISLTTSRPIDQDIKLREIGRLRIQIIYCPSFESYSMWDIREKYENERISYEVYENHLESITTILPGYQKLPIEHATISNLIDVLNTTTLKLQLNFISHQGLDGTHYGLNLFNDLHREIKLRWWNEPPIELIALGRILNSTIELLKKIEGKVNVQ